MCKWKTIVNKDGSKDREFVDCKKTDCSSALNFRLIGLVHLVETRSADVGIRPTLGLVSSDQTKGFLVSSEVGLDEADQIR